MPAAPGMTVDEHRSAWQNLPAYLCTINFVFVPNIHSGFARTSDFQADPHSGRSARACRRNGFSTSPAAFSRFAAFCRQARAESRNPGFVLLLSGAPAFGLRGSPGSRISKRTVIPAGAPAFGLRGSPGSRISKRTVIPAGARAVAGETGFRPLPQPFRGSPFSAGKRARRAGIQAMIETVA